MDFASCFINYCWSWGQLWTWIVVHIPEYFVLRFYLDPKWDPGMKILTIKGKAAQCIEEDREECRGIIMINECLSQTHSIIHTNKLGFLLSAGCRSHDDKWGAHWEKTLTASVSDKRCESRLHTKCYWIMGQGEPSSNGLATVMGTV